MACRRILHTFGCALVLWAGVGTVPARAAEFRGVRLNVADPEAAAQWYCKHLGGSLIDRDTPSAAVEPAPMIIEEGTGPNERFNLNDFRRPDRSVRFGNTIVEFVRAAGSVPGSVGSGVDHLGFGYADLDRAMARFAKTGVEIVSPVEKEGPIRYAFIKDRWNTLIELVEDREIHGFHHIHLATTDPKATLKWYTDLFGGRVTRYAGVLAGIRYGNVWVLVKTLKHPPEPTKDRSLGRLEWTFTGVSTKALLEQLSGLRRGYQLLQVTRQSKEIHLVGPDGVQLSLIVPDR